MKIPGIIDNDGNQIDFVDKGAPHVETANVGDVIAVKAVDEKGVPTEWEASGKIKELNKDLEEATDRITALENEPKVPEDLIRKVDTNTKVNEEQNRRLTNLEYASRGVLYREDESESEDYTKDIPSDAMPYGTFDKIGGKTIVFNQMIGESYPNEISGELYEQTVEDVAESFDVDKLMGKTVVWNQLLKDIFEPEWEPHGFTVTRKNDCINIKYKTSQYDGFVYNYAFAEGHKYFRRVKVYVNSGHVSVRLCTSIIAWNSLITQQYVFNTLGLNELSDIVTGYTDNKYIAFAFCSTDMDVDIYSVELVDLTVMFGSGNEPDLETCKRIFMADYYLYSEPILENVNAEQIISDGKNIVDGIFENGNIGNKGQNADGTNIAYMRSRNFYKVDGGCTYNGCFHSESFHSEIKPYQFYIIEYDENKNHIDGSRKAYNNVANLIAGQSFTVSKDTRYIRCFLYLASGITDLNPDTYMLQIEKSNSKTSYTPYHSPDTRNAKSIIEKYFPDGMKAIGNIKDELNLKTGKAIRRVKDVDLGTLTWNWQNTYQLYFTQIPDCYYTNKYGTSYALCPRYQTNKTESPSIDDMSIAVGNNFIGGGAKSVLIKDSNYINNVSIFRNSLDGLILYYRLAEDIITDIDSSDLAILRSIWCEQGGTITYENALDISLPIEVSETFSLTEWEQPLDSTHKYNHNGSLVSGVSAVDAKKGDTLVDMTRACVEDVNAYVEVGAEKNDGELISADVTEMVAKGANLINVDEALQRLGYVKQDDGYYFRKGTPSGHLWDNEKGYSGQISFGVRGYISGGTNATIRANYTDGTRLNLLIRNDTFGKLITPTGKIVSYIDIDTSGGPDVYIKELCAIKGTDLTDYVPYFEKHQALDSIIKKHFPDGMKSDLQSADYFDLENGVAVNNIVSLDLGEMEWQKDGGNAKQIRTDLKWNTVIKIPISNSIAFTGLCAKYKTTSWNNVPVGYGNIACTDKGYIGVCDEYTHSETDLNKLKEYLSGTILYCERAEPIITPLDPADIESLKILQVEAGGSLTFIQSDQRFHISVPNKETFLVKTGGAE